MPKDYSIWKLLKRPDRRNALWWKNCLYTSRERRAAGSGGERWRSLQYQWPVLHDAYDTVTPDFIAKNAKLNDWIIVADVGSDHLGPGQSFVHYITADLLTDTGTLYRHDGERWKAIVYRSSLNTKEVRDVVRAPGHLAWVEGKKNDLLLAGFSPKTKEQARELLDEKYPFYYRYIRGAEVEEVCYYYDVWNVKLEGIVEQRDGVDARGFRVDAERRQQADDKLNDVVEFMKQNPRWYDEYDEKQKRYPKREIVKDGLQFFFEQGVPSATAGTATPVAVTNVICDLAASSEAATQMSQSGHEVLAVGFSTALDASRLYILLNDDAADAGELKTVSTNLVANFLKGGPAVTTFITVLADALKWAPLGLQTAAEVMPFVSVVIGMFESGRNVRKADHAFARYAVFKNMEGTFDPDSDDDAAELIQLLRFAKGKLNRKGNRLYATAAAGGIGVVGGTFLGIAVVVGGANAWNPVGWAIGGVALAGGIGVTGYVIYRKATKEKRHRRRIAKGRPADATEFADRLIDLYWSKGKTGKYTPEAAELLGVLGVKTENGKLLIDGDRARQRSVAVRRIVRHFV